MLRKLILAGCFALLASPSFAANKAFISEYNTMAHTDNGGVPAQIASEPSVTQQTPVDFTAGATSSAAFSSTTRFIRLMCDTRCAIRFRPSCTGGSAATTSSAPLAADAPEYFGVKAGDCVSVISSP